MGTPAESRQSSVRVVLTVDVTGLVHRIETWSDASPSERVEVTLISVSPDLPAIQVPTVFQDMATGQQIG